jgi:hypothetical protein
LIELRTAVGWPGDLSLAQWLHIYGITREFKPDLVLELGRGYGNSTTAFTQAIADEGHGSVVSVSYDGERAWNTVTREKLERLVPAEWFDRLEIREMDIRDLDVGDLCRGHGRILVWWDAHGADLATFLLSRLPEALNEAAHLICVHDVQDARFEAVVHEYERPDGQPSYWQGYLSSPFEEIVAIYDFLSRNGIPYDTAAASLARFRDEAEAEWTSLRDSLAPLGAAEAAEAGGWMWFSLSSSDWRDLAVPRERPTLADVTIESASPQPIIRAARSLKSRTGRLLQRVNR